MPVRVSFFGCGFVLLIIWHLQADEPAEIAGDAVAAKMLTITDVVLNNHIDPPTRQQMLLVGIKSLYETAGIDPPAGLSGQISSLATDEELRSFIKHIWSSTANSKASLKLKEFSQSLTKDLSANKLLNCYWSFRRDSTTMSGCRMQRLSKESN